MFDDRHQSAIGSCHHGYANSQDEVRISGFINIPPVGAGGAVGKETRPLLHVGQHSGESPERRYFRPVAALREEPYMEEEIWVPGEIRTQWRLGRGGSKRLREDAHSEHDNIPVGDLNSERRCEDPDRNRTGLALGAGSITGATLWRSPKDFPSPEEVRRGKGRLLPRVFLSTAENFRGLYDGITAVVKIGPRRMWRDTALRQLDSTRKIEGNNRRRVSRGPHASHCSADERRIRTLCERLELIKEIEKLDEDDHENMLRQDLEMLKSLREYMNDRREDKQICESKSASKYTLSVLCIDENGKYCCEIGLLGKSFKKKCSYNSTSWVMWKTIIS
ncbi:hypothetical protein EAG_10768 [Camponotus floridanus]|uniref:Uncharacterized protein n=1 Tax=Camponotus floridanus TaxID=104421 RepID=E2AND7_CAMFO|nr:hypothetical protein EAG_10768 [Camponotus floridanus]